VNHRAAPRLRVDGKLTANDLQPLLHAGQAEPGPSYRLVNKKTSARILDCQIEGVDVTVQIDVGVSRPAMLDDILQAFLQHGLSLSALLQVLPAPTATHCQNAAESG
jgi:hypothetical protein